MIDCAAIVNDIKADIKNEVSHFSRKPCLAIIQVGNDPASKNYVKGKISDCEEVGIETRLMKLPEDSTRIVIELIIYDLNNDPIVDGIILQLPLPDHLKKYEDELTSLIETSKDVDGFKDESHFIPCTPMGVMTLLDRLNIDLKGKNVALVGYGRLVGKPLFKYLINKKATVTVCRSHTSKEDRDFYCRNSDIIITAVGKRNLITRDSLCLYKNQIIIDCGITVEDCKQYGDCAEEVYNVVNLCTPRVKGMGLFTRVSLLQNTIKAYKIKFNLLEN